jgi:hypothetical protein
MRSIALIFFILFLFCGPFTISAQSKSELANSVKEQKVKLLQSLTSVSSDASIVHSLTGYFDSEINTIYRSIHNDFGLNTRDRDKAVRSLIYFIDELNKSLLQHKLDIYDIRGAVNSYKNVLTALLLHKPIGPLLEPLEPNQSQLMAAAFSQYKEYALLDDVAIYKRVASSPEFILQFLENKPGFRFADSLLVDAAAYDPLRIVYYLNQETPGVQDKIRKTNNIYLKQITLLSGDKYASELLPFVVQIAQNKIKPDDILQTRTDATKYFQLLVNTMQESISGENASSTFLKPLRNGIKQKALAFYVNEINELHTSPEAIRFASVKGLRTQDLYYIITSCGDELYTSSYLGLYKRLMEQFKDQTADSLFDMMGYDNFRTFIRLAANYNVLDDFLHHLSPDRMKNIMQRFIGSIEKDESTALEKAMDIADSFTSVGNDAELSGLVESELQSNLDRCTTAHNYLGIRLYNILTDILSLVKQKDGINKVWATLGDYDLLTRSALQNEKGEIVELVLFYGDEDGIASYNNFLRSFTDKSKWEISKKPNWVSIRSTGEKPLLIYANLPLDVKDEKDLMAQDSLVAYLKKQSLEPTIIVHRGHSYHLDKTLKRLKPSVRLAILGSCGGYNKALSIANINPDVQVIGSKKTGSKSVNDPILDEINETLINGKDLQWPDLWKQLTDRFSKNEAVLSLFNEYFPPSHNLSLFVLKLFNSTIL